ncbi:MAG TPA: branched-chain amino acid aminotransferase [Campylobacterales bacterium]|nr:branched-chain amino acid aminotransferase [Campylobacterales bacterium]
MEKIFFETIKIRDGKILNIEYHNKRFNKTIKDNFNIDRKMDLKNFINPPKKGVYRCKLIYDKDILEISFTPYKKRDIKILKLIDSNIEYPYKYLNREEINKLFEKRGDGDDILIVKNGFISDTSICNVAFFDGKYWLTPKTPLLNGTTRERLLEENRIYLANIKVEDIKKFNKFAIMNAMIGFEEIIDGKII